MSHKKLVSFRLPDELMQDLKKKADTDSISVTELVCRLLRQGLEVDEEGLATTLMDERVARLEAEIQELKKTEIASINPGMPHTPLYAMLAHGAISTQSDRETSERLTRVEVILEKLIKRVGVSK